MVSVSFMIITNKVILNIKLSNITANSDIDAMHKTEYKNRVKNFVVRLGSVNFGTKKNPPVREAGSLLTSSSHEGSSTSEIK